MDGNQGRVLIFERAVAHKIRGDDSHGAIFGFMAEKPPRRGRGCAVKRQRARVPFQRELDRRNRLVGRNVQIHLDLCRGQPLGSARPNPVFRNPDAGGFRNALHALGGTFSICEIQVADLQRVFAQRRVFFEGEHQFAQFVVARCEHLCGLWIQKNEVEMGRVFAHIRRHGKVRLVDSQKRDGRWVVFEGEADAGNGLCIRQRNGHGHRIARRADGLAKDQPRLCRREMARAEQGEHQRDVFHFRRTSFRVA